MPYTELQNTRKVIFTRPEVAVFVATHPGCGLRGTRAHWFEFDEDGRETDNDVPQQDEGLGASHLSAQAWQWLIDEAAK